MEPTRGDELRAAMRRFPAGVSVLTADADGDRIGITVGSLASVSLEPPLISLAIGQQLAAHELVRRAGGFALSILRGDQAHVAQHFARGVPPIALWVGVPAREGPRGPLVEGALAWLQCSLDAEHRAGDHTIFVGAVESVELGSAGDGLVYRHGAYGPA